MIDMFAGKIEVSLWDLVQALDEVQRRELVECALTESETLDMVVGILLEGETESGSAPDARDLASARRRIAELAQAITLAGIQAAEEKAKRAEERRAKAEEESYQARRRIVALEDELRGERERRTLLQARLARLEGRDIEMGTESMHPVEEGATA